MRLSCDGLDTTILTGFLNTILDVLDLEPRPTHLTVVFDSKNSGVGDGPGTTVQPLTWRHELYPGYKAHRNATPSVIYESSDIIERLLAPLHVAMVKESGVEADDCIATLATRAEKSGLLVTIVSLDSDYNQLLSPAVRMLKMPTSTRAARDKTRPYWTPFTDRDFEEKFPGIHPHQWVDVVALKGDASDNIKGVAGIGEKSALRLVAEYGSLESILADVGNIRDTRSRNNLNKEGAADAAKVSLSQGGAEKEMKEHKSTTSRGEIKIYHEWRRDQVATMTTTTIGRHGRRRRRLYRFHSIYYLLLYNFLLHSLRLTYTKLILVLFVVFAPWCS